ncbi:MAG: fasciclin domain-containing protein [Cyanobacteria bacterium SZAS TMP-1]|nr:fasciclin domain-containing protein [Cyanobacteria bacterium SZAS TMP-1]
MNLNKQKLGCLFLTVACSIGLSGQLFAQARDHSASEYLNDRGLANKTQTFTQKEGFERKPKDIINTLKDNEVTGFSTMLDGLSQAYGLDKTLKDNGPFTFFAVSDADFKKLPQDDKDTLWANKKKLKEVLSYHVVPGIYYEKALTKMNTVKTMEGREITIEKKNGNLLIDGVLCKTADIPCTNGVIFILEKVIMPPLSK